MDTLSLGIICSVDDLSLLAGKINKYIPLFDSVYITVDCDPSEPIRPFNWFRPFADCQLVKRALNSDFAAQRNSIMARNECDWVLFMDADEDLPTGLRKNLRKIVRIANENQIDVVGFSRINFFDNAFHEFYPDTQYRLVKHHILYTNNSPYRGASPGLHETPQGASYLWFNNYNIVHIKTQKKQDDCVKQWQKIRSLHIKNT